MIDNNTLYTQYKPNQHQSQMPTNEPNLISTSSASSTSTASCSSASSSSSYTAAPHVSNLNNDQKQKSYFANRDSLFYHSTDNYRYNTTPSNNDQQTFRDKQKRILEHQHVSRLSQKQGKSVVPIVKHSVPFNVSNQVHTICDMFEEDCAVNGFNRYGRNQSSTKSNPPGISKDLYGYGSFKVNGGSGVSGNTIIEDEYFHRSFKTNFSQNFNLQTPVIVPHPAQV